MNARKYCQDLVRMHDYTHYLTSLFSPSEQAQRTILAVRAFNVEVARIPEIVKENGIADIRYMWWKQTLADTLRNSPNDHPVAIELADCLAKQKLSSLFFKKLLKEREAHHSRTSFASMDMLENYAEQTASSVLYLHLEALEVKNANVEHAASHLGKAIGIATVLKSIPYTLPNLFIPQDILLRHNVSTQDVLRMDPKKSASKNQLLKDAVFEVATRANDQLLTAKSFIDDNGPLHPAEVAALLPIVPLKHFLDRLEKADFDIFNPYLLSKSIALPFLIWKQSRNGVFRF